MKSARYALALAGGYALLAAIYIVVSSRIAANLSANVDELRRIETTKGVLFVVVTALAVFAGAWAMISRLEHAHAENRRRAAAILTSERRVFAGLLAAATAHDANNVLMTVIADLEELRAVLGADPKVERLTEATERLIALNRRLSDTVRQGREGETQDVPLLNEIRHSLDSIRSHLLVRGCDVRVHGDESFSLRTHPLLVHQIVTNLVLNAAEATQRHGRIDVWIKHSGDVALLEVHDDGPGVPEERRAGLFDALLSSKTGGGGLGLFSVKACATALGGSVDVGASPLGGACFRVRLPANTLEERAPRAPEVAAV